MGHDHQQSSTSGAVVAIVAAVLLVAILGLVAVAGLLFVRGSIESRMVAEEQRAIVELHRAETVAERTVAQIRIQDGMVQIRQSSVAATPEANLNFEVSIDREGIASIDGKEVGLDELKARFAKLKAETSNTFSVQINADSECLIKHIIPVLDVCEEVGDIDYRVASSKNSDELSDESNSEN